MAKLGHTLGLSDLSTAEAADARQVMRRMRWLTVLAPAAFLLPLLVVVNLLGRQVPWFTAILVGFSACAVGIVVFSRAVFGVLERLQGRLQQQNRQLHALFEAGVQTTANLSRRAVLHNIARASRELLRTRYTAIAITQDGRLEELITAGLSEDERSVLAEVPEDGLLAQIAAGNEVYRSADLSRDPRFRRLPPGMPQIDCLLSVPLLARGTVIGHILVSDKDHREFSDEDEAALKTLAVQAAIAIENARLYEDAHDTAAFKERERIAMDLHDGVIQQLYGVSLKLDSGIDQLDTDPSQVREAMDGAIEDINSVIREIRSHIFDLRPQQLEGRNLKEALVELLADLSVNTLITTDLMVEPGTDPTDGLSPEHTLELVNIARSTLENVRKHAQARNVRAELSVIDGMFSMRIADDGVGIDEHEAYSERGGIASMRQRAYELDWLLSVGWEAGGGTAIDVRVPLQATEAQ
jgi:signal transduction histidine kinase